MADRIKIVVTEDGWMSWCWRLYLNGNDIAYSGRRADNKEPILEEAYRVAALIPGCRVEVRE